MPRRIVITYRQEEGQPQFRASFTEWRAACRPTCPMKLFAFTPAEGAEKIPFAFGRPGESTIGGRAGEGGR